MERNRIREFLIDLPELDHGGRPWRHDHAVERAPSSFVAMPAAMWAELGASGQAQLASMYQQAFEQADAQLRSDCAQRLLESITTR